MDISIITKKLTLALCMAVLLVFVGLFSQPVMAASDNAALALDWRIALPAELPPAQPEMASLDQ